MLATDQPSSLCAPLAVPVSLYAVSADSGAGYDLSFMVVGGRFIGMNPTYSSTVHGIRWLYQGSDSEADPTADYHLSEAYSEFVRNDYHEGVTHPDALFVINNISPGKSCPISFDGGIALGMQNLTQKDDHC